MEVFLDQFNLGTRSFQWYKNIFNSPNGGGGTKMYRDLLDYVNRRALPGGRAVLKTESNSRSILIFSWPSRVFIPSGELGSTFGL